MSTPLYYFDISKIGKDFTGNKDILILTNEQAVAESVKNIISTEPGERVWYPDFGCSLSEFLFEPIDVITATIMKNTIINAISKFETRIENLAVDIIEEPDLETYTFNISFNMKTSTNTQTLTLELHKIR